MSKDSEKSRGQSTKGFVLIVSLLIGLFLISKVHTNYVDNKIRESKFITVAKVDEISHGARKISIDYKFKLDNKTYHGGLPVREYPSDDIVGKFYELHVSKTNPEFNKIFLGREITDTAKIKAVGFSLTKTKKTNQFQQY